MSVVGLAIVALVAYALCGLLGALLYLARQKVKDRDAETFRLRRELSAAGVPLPRRDDPLERAFALPALTPDHERKEQP